jgi:uncharacterized protein YdeI (YjbR/CyaY-like superfamily)
MAQARKQSANSFATRLFKSQDDWSVWLAKNHDKKPGLWLRFAKKDSGLRSVTYKEAVEVALCHGWIDGQARAGDESTWEQKFCPRTAKSKWSKINRDKATALIANGKMATAGLAAVESAKKDGRWKAAYDSPSKSTVPEDLQAALDANLQAKAFFETLNSANRYAILWRIQTVKKAETRARKIQQFISMLKRKEKIHP